MRKKTRSKKEYTPEEKAANRKKALKALRNLLIKIGIIALSIYILLTYVFAIRICHSNDMFPNIKDGDLVICTRIGNDSIAHEDPVIYRVEGTECYGRVIAIGGDKVEINEEGLIVNGSLLFTELPYVTKPAPEGVLDYPLTVPDGSYFILGDLREQATDSRVFGTIPAEDIIGKVFFISRHRSF